MAKFYQHMEPGEYLGKVTRLKYIDDISDDELIIYMFTDGTKCDEHYIAEVNNLKAFNGQYVMTELTGPTNQWKFEVKTFDHTKTKKVTSQNGEEWELPDPCISKNGDYLSISSPPTAFAGM